MSTKEVALMTDDIMLNIVHEHSIPFTFGNTKMIHYLDIKAFKEFNKRVVCNRHIIGTPVYDVIYYNCTNYLHPTYDSLWNCIGIIKSKIDRKFLD